MKVRDMTVVVLLGSQAACGGGGTPKPAETPPAASADSPEQACLAKAATPRTPLADAPERVGIAHILVRHKELKRSEGATRGRGEACLRAQEAREKLLAGGAWEAVVTEYSDAAGATQGDLGSVSKAELDATFAAAAFSLAVGELSHVVETERGFHVIARNE